jgi:dTDP-4-amino-4,6-dideoxygalactose transaminase
MDWKIPLADIDFDSREEEAVLEVLKSRWLTMGSVTQAFEEEFSSYVGAPHAIAVANGTAALHLACLGIGLGPGDEVIVPSLTFVATANAIRYTGAIPVFADIESEQDLDISITSIEQKLTDRTRAIIIMHYGGYACDMPAITRLAKAHGLMVIEDAAHAIGTEDEGCKAGTWGDVGCFSFFSNKNMTTGEGGMVVTNNEAAADKMRIMRSHGMTSMSWDRHRGHAWSYDVVELGYNYRMDEMSAVLGLAQLKRIDELMQKRERVARMYTQRLAKMRGVQTPYRAPTTTRASWFVYVIRFAPEIDRDRVVRELAAREIPSRPYFAPIHLQPFYRAQFGFKDGDFPITERIARSTLALPFHGNLTEREIDWVCKTLSQVL